MVPSSNSHLKNTAGGSYTAQRQGGTMVGLSSTTSVITKAIQVKDINQADQTIYQEEVLTTVLFVVDLGPDCYLNKDKFPSGPWCKKGDFVLVRPNSGSRLVIHGREFRMINDDTVEGVVDDPRGIKRK